MKVVNIKLSLLENAKLFADIASRYPFDVDLRVGRYVVDGKSVLGVCSLDMSKPITVEIYDDNCDAYQKKERHEYSRSPCYRADAAQSYYGSDDDA